MQGNCLPSDSVLTVVSHVEPETLNSQVFPDRVDRNNKGGGEGWTDRERKAAGTYIIRTGNFCTAVLSTNSGSIYQ